MVLRLVEWLQPYPHHIASYVTGPRLANAEALSTAPQQSAMWHIVPFHFHAQM